MSRSILEAGFSRRCITPQVPVSLAGYFNLRFWTGVFDDIYVQALVLRQGDELSAIIQFDLVSVTTALAEALAERCNKFSGLNLDNMLMCATHTHTAPEMRLGNPGNNKEYNNFLLDQAETTVKEALENFEEVEAYGGETSDDRFAFNRRYWMKDGTVLTNPGKFNPDIDRVEGPIDPLIPMIGLKVNDKLKYLITNISNHSDTIGGTEVSADWPGFTRRRMEQVMGEGSACFTLISPAGNINHFDTQWNNPQNSHQEAKRIGEGYAESIQAGIGSLRKLCFEQMQVKNVKVTAGPPHIPDKQFKEARDIIAKYPELDARSSDITLNSEDLARKEPIVLKFFAEMLLETAKDQVDREFNLVGIFLGQACVISLPCEPFVEVGLTIREKVLRGRTVLIASHSGSGAKHLFGGYIPNVFNYGRGGYETTPRSNPFAPDTAEKLVEGAKKLAP
jgi:hypothetical protein